MTEVTQAEYEKYSKQLDALESKQSSSLLRRFKDKVLSLVKSEDEMQECVFLSVDHALPVAVALRDRYSYQ